jgi:hypothetical protein
VGYWGEGERQRTHENETNIPLIIPIRQLAEGIPAYRNEKSVSTVSFQPEVLYKSLFKNYFKKVLDSYLTS